MKKIFQLFFLLLCSNLIFAQPEIKNPIKKIEVLGTAEKEITPDIIYFNISLKEYYNGKSKVEIGQLEKELERAIIASGISKEDFTIANIYGYNYEWGQKKDPNFEARKQYRLKLTNLKNINSILSKVDSKGIESVNIDGFDHSKMETFKKEIKIAALLAAKEKANYLLTSINEKLGSVIEIQESDNNGHMYPMYKSANMMMSAEASGDAGSDIEIKPIKLNYQIKVIFAIQ